MASIAKTVKGYRAQLCIKGVRDSKTFRTLREANAWSAARETALRSDAGKTPGERHTFKDALTRYIEEIVPKKRGEKAERVRVGRMIHSPHIRLDKPMGEIDETDIVLFRDARLREVSPGSVLREIALLSALFEIARTEWKWVVRNPVKDVRKPSKPAHRERVISFRETRAMLRSLGYSKQCRTTTGAVAYAFLLALATGMRAGEICKLTWAQDKRSYLSGVGTKTGTRDVPLSRSARRLLDRLKGWDSTLVVNVSESTLDALFRRHRVRCGLSGFTFHDSRHSAATRIAGKVDVLTLCKIFGWSSPVMAMVYYNPTAAEISKRL